jgi:hypothetical protein
MLKFVKTLIDFSLILKFEDPTNYVTLALSQSIQIGGFTRISIENVYFELSMNKNS